MCVAPGDKLPNNNRQTHLKKMNESKYFMRICLAFFFYFPLWANAQKNNAKISTPLGFFMSVIRKIKENLQMIASNCFGGGLRC